MRCAGGARQKQSAAAPHPSPRRTPPSPHPAPPLARQVALGIVAPPWFSGPLEAAVGARACESMLQLATLLPPARALALGAVDELAPRGAVLRAAAEAAARYGAMPAAARDASKQLMRGALVARTIGTPALRAEDLARTWAYFRSPEVQAGLRVYLERLSARKR